MAVKFFNTKDMLRKYYDSEVQNITKLMMIRKIFIFRISRTHGNLTYQWP